MEVLFAEHSEILNEKRCRNIKGCCAQTGRHWRLLGQLWIPGIKWEQIKAGSQPKAGFFVLSENK